MPFPIPGPFELILLLVIILVIFGPGKLPDIGNAVGKGIREFRKASSELEDSVRGEAKRTDETKAPRRLGAQSLTSVGRSGDRR